MAAAQQTRLVYRFFSRLGEASTIFGFVHKKLGHFIKAGSLSYADESEAEEEDSHQQNETQG